MRRGRWPCGSRTAARWEAKQLEQDFDRLRAAHDELIAGRDALLADNDRLRSQVRSSIRRAII